MLTALRALGHRVAGIPATLFGRMRLRLPQKAMRQNSFKAIFAASGGDPCFESST
jgi:hypothetical protein